MLDTDDEAVLEFIRESSASKRQLRAQLPSLIAVIADGSCVVLAPGVKAGKMRHRRFSIFGHAWTITCAPGTPWYDGVSCIIHVSLLKRHDGWAWICRLADKNGLVEGDDWLYIMYPSSLERQDHISKFVSVCKDAYSTSNE
jgi:hypothetical protein